MAIERPIDPPSKRGPGHDSALRVEEIAKAYGVVQALSPASLELAPGELHALVGENGSGKSTFVGIVSGTVIPDGGRIEIAGRECSRHTPWEAQSLGALSVFQDGSVITELSVAQNLYLGTPVANRPRYRNMSSWASERLREFGLEHIPAKLAAERLSPAERQLLEIVRAIMAEPKVLLLDEATSALDPAGVDIALALMNRAAEAGSAVLFVTHRLSEVFRVARRITVLRDSCVRGTYDTSEIDTDGLVELMAGRSIKVEFPERVEDSAAGPTVLSAAQLEGDGFGPVDLSLRSGEIVGIAGADGNGQIELLAGLGAIGDPRGRLEVDGRQTLTFHQANEAGVSFLSSDRHSESVFQTLSIRENLVISVLGKLARSGVISRTAERRQVEESIERFGIKLGSAEQPMTSLSGGNQQKVALGKVLATNPKVLLCDEPTQGVDVRSRLDIYRMLRSGADAGLAIAILSSDAAELAGLCDRVVVLSRGKIVAELTQRVASEESIVHAFAAGSTEPAEVREDAASSASTGLGRGMVDWMRGFVHRHSEYARLSLLAGMILLVGLYAQSQTGDFITTPNIYNVLLLALPLAAVAAAQYAVMFVGGIDVSVAGVMGVTIALLSYYVQGGSTAGALVISLAIAAGVGIVVGIANASLIERLKISPVIATIATLGILQGIGLILRSTPGGAIDIGLTELLTKKLGFLPWPIVVIAVVFVLADGLLRATGTGLRLRAVGLNAAFAYRLGIDAPRLRQVSYVICSIVAAIAGVVLAGQVGIGDSTVGNQYILLAIAAPIIGGASLLGGRGTFVGCLLGSVLIALGLTLPTTLSLENGWNYIFTGGLTLVALAINTRGVGSGTVLQTRTLWRRLRTLGRQGGVAGA